MQNDNADVKVEYPGGGARLFLIDVTHGYSEPPMQAQRHPPICRPY